MQKRLWLQFHFWTIGCVVLLSIANFASALRPYSASRTAAASPDLFIGENSLRLSDRSPASHTETDLNSAANLRLALKTTRIGCDSTYRLKVVAAVRQLRLQFDACEPNDAIIGVQNKTNDFEATVFGSASTEAESMAGTFTTPELGRKDRKIAGKAAAFTPTGGPVSTDYIALVSGGNEIKIRRARREQVLVIERR